MGNSALAYDLGKRIRELRLKQGWTQRELAQRIGIHKSVISYFELGERYPAYDKLLRIADTFHVSTDYLLRGGEPSQLDVARLNERQLRAVRELVDAMNAGDEPES